MYVPSATSPEPHPSPRKPRSPFPPKSTDSHCHVFGPGDRYPYALDRGFTPRDAPREALAAIHAHLGIERAVLVQASSNGYDHETIIDAIAEGSRELRGIALIHEEMGQAFLQHLDDSGFRGFRVLPPKDGVPSLARTQALLAAVRPFGWHAQFLINRRGIAEFAELIDRLDGPVVIDHMADVDLRHGAREEDVDTVRRLLDSDRVWLKISCAERLSATGAPYEDAAALGAVFVAHRPDRILWGTDYPHVNMDGSAPDDGLLADLLLDMAPTEADRQRILVDNPARLYRF